MSEAPFSSPSLDVEAISLSRFAAMVAEDTGQFLGFRAAHIDELLTEDPPFAGGGLSEGMEFHGSYRMLKSALGQLLADAHAGLVALSGAAATIADDYTAEDAATAATVHSVLGGRHE